MLGEVVMIMSRLLGPSSQRVSPAAGRSTLDPLQAGDFSDGAAMVERGQQISIGRFAGLTGISANTLRRYDELGVLSPAFTDPETRYRLYAVEQLDTGILIRLLRDLDVPLDEIAAQIGDGDPERLKDVLALHRGRIAGRLVELERILQLIDGALEAEHGLLPYEIEVVTLDPIWVVSRRTTTSRPRLDEELERCLLELEDELAATADSATGRELVLYHNALYWYQGLDMEVCLPVTGDAAGAHGGWQLPGGDCMRTVYRGPWDDIWQAYSMMLARIARKGCEVRGPVREAYLADERDTDDPLRYVTEITWPVRPRAESFE
jgi:DNA-binding transcriptional MerR regulator